MPCLLPILIVSLLAVAGPVRGDELTLMNTDGPRKLVQVRDSSTGATLLFTSTIDDPTWTMDWSDLGVTDADGPPTVGATGGIDHFARSNTRPAKAPTIIAAPLPPALLSGLIGLAGVYAYKRRHRLR